MDFEQVSLIPLDGSYDEIDIDKAIDDVIKFIFESYGSVSSRIFPSAERCSTLASTL